MAWFRRRRNVAPTIEIESDPNTGSFFRRLGGRRHRVGVPYILPADMQEINRLDFQHYMLRYALRGNYAAPVRNPANILDVGGGTGRWAIEMAGLFTRANCISLDLTDPSVPGGALIGVTPPPNVRFVVANVLEGLPHPDASFDFVHQRLLTGALPADRCRRIAGPGSSASWCA